MVFGKKLSSRTECKWREKKCERITLDSKFGVTKRADAREKISRFANKNCLSLATSRARIIRDNRKLSHVL